MLNKTLIEEKFSNPNPEEVKSFGWNRIKTKEEIADEVYKIIG